MEYSLIRKCRDYIENVIHMDSSCNNKIYNSTINYMETAETIGTEIEKISDTNNSQEVFEDIVNSAFQNECQIVESLIHQIEVSRLGDKNLKNRYDKKTLFRVEEFNKILKNIFDETKIIDSLVVRNNKFYIKNKMPYFTTTRENALEELSKTIDYMPINFLKITFWLNKLAKYSDYIKFYNNFKQDSINSKKMSNERTLYVSKLKTDFLNCVYQNILEHYPIQQNKKLKNMQDIQEQCSKYNLELKKVISENAKKYADEYNSLFSENFSNLNLEKDLNNLTSYYNMKDNIYSIKNLLATTAIVDLNRDYTHNRNIKSIYNWGINKDRNNRYLLGIEMNGYPMPLTIHLSHKYLFKLVNSMQRSGYDLTGKMTFPKYNSLIDKDATIVTTNILYSANSSQKAKLKEDAEKNADNKLMQHLNCQVNGRSSFNLNEKIEISRKDLEKVADKER